MKCRTCDTDIADKALICYRCGAATTSPRIAPPGERPGRGPWPVIAALLALIAVSLLLLPQLADGVPRMAGWVAVVVAAVLIVWGLRPQPRRSRLLGRRRRRGR
jgi:peptidoglycan/LPS O-acetylase OafA/YrhL